MKIKEIFAKTILTKAAIPGFDYCINPYIGCGYGFRYCYASSMKRFTGYLEPWGKFIDIKVIYRKAKLEKYLEEDYFRLVGVELKERFDKKMEVFCDHREIWIEKKKLRLSTLQTAQ